MAAPTWCVCGFLRARFMACLPFGFGTRMYRGKKRPLALGGRKRSRSADSRVPAGGPDPAVGGIVLTASPDRGGDLLPSCCRTLAREDGRVNENWKGHPRRGARESDPWPTDSGASWAPGRPPRSPLGKDWHPIRPPSGGMVRPEASRRGLRRDLRRLADPGFPLANALPQLARDPEAPVHGPHRSPPGQDPARRGRGGCGAGERSPGPLPSQGAPEDVDPPRLGDDPPATHRPDQQDRVLDRGPPQRGAGPGGEHPGGSRAAPALRGYAARAHHAGGAGGLCDRAQHELPDPGKLRPPASARPLLDPESRCRKTHRGGRWRNCGSGSPTDLTTSSPPGGASAGTGGRATSRRWPTSSAEAVTTSSPSSWTAGASASPSWRGWRPTSSSTWWRPSGTMTPRSRTWQPTTSSWVCATPVRARGDSPWP